MMDKMDLKLISLLENDGRATYSRLAKIMGIKAITVGRRVESLINNRVIAIHAIPDPIRMGYHAPVIICMNISSDKLDNLCNHLKSNFNVNLIALTLSQYNLLAIAYFEDWDRLRNFLSTNLADRKDIPQMKLFFIDEIKKRYHGSQDDNINSPKTIDIDIIDKKIIDELNLDGRATCSYLANKLGISLSAASKRVRRLLKKKAIKIQAIINPAKVIYQVNAFMLLRVDKNKLDDIVRNLHSVQEIIGIMTITNDYDLFLSLEAKDLEAIYELINRKIMTLSGV
jgi:DNA-binding Lrp family transcriptional regulator